MVYSSLFIGIAVLALSAGRMATSTIYVLVHLKLFAVVCFKTILW